jgi:hypothetical protein
MDKLLAISKEELRKLEQEFEKIKGASEEDLLEWENLSLAQLKALLNSKELQLKRSEEKVKFFKTLMNSPLN